MHHLCCVQLDLKVPKDFLSQLGCEIVTDFVGFYFDQSDDYAVYDNGVTEADVDRKCWESWKDQRRVAAVFDDIEKLWKDRGESYGLILNTETATFFRAQTHAINEFLYRHYVEASGLNDMCTPMKFSSQKT